MKKHSTRFYRALPVAFALSALVLTSSVLAESPDEPTPASLEQRGAHKRGTFKAKRAAFFRQELGLDATAAKALAKELRALRKQTRGIRKQQRQLVTKLEQLLGEDNAEAQAFTYNLRALAYNKAQLAKYKAAKQELFDKRLSPRQRAQLIVKRSQMRKNGRKFRGHQRGKRMGHRKEGRGRRGNGPAGF